MEIGLETISEMTSDRSVCAQAHCSFSSSVRRMTRFGSGSGKALFSEPFGDTGVGVFVPERMVRFCF